MSAGGRSLQTVLTASLLLVAAGCATAPVDRYYVLENRPPQELDGVDRPTAPLPLTLKVRPLRTAEVLQDERLVRRLGTGEISYYDTHRWAAPVDRMVTEKIVTTLRATLPVEQVLPHASPQRADLLLEGDVLAFEERKEEARIVGAVELLLRLTRPGDDRLLWKGRLKRTCPTGGGAPIDTVRALDRCLQGALAGLATDLTPVVTNLPEAD